MGVLDISVFVIEVLREGDYIKEIKGGRKVWYGEKGQSYLLTPFQTLGTVRPLVRVYYLPCPTAA